MELMYMMHKKMISGTDNKKKKNDEDKQLLL